MLPASNTTASTAIMINFLLRHIPLSPPFGYLIA
jgi:hypothetical protein